MDVAAVVEVAGDCVSLAVVLAPAVVLASAVVALEAVRAGNGTGLKY